MLVALLVWLIVGGVAGWLAGLLVRGAGFGVLGDMVVGVVGGIIGGFLLGGLFGVSGGGLLWSCIASLLGAVLLLFIVRLILGNRTRSTALYCWEGLLSNDVAGVLCATPVGGTKGARCSASCSPGRQL